MDKYRKFIEIKGKPIIYYTIKKFSENKKIDNIVVVLSKDEVGYFKENILEKYNFKATCFVIGYKTTVKNSQNPYKHQYLRKSDLVNDEYVEYYSHSYNLHHNTKYPNTKLIETLSTQEIINDFKQNENIVSSKYFAFPYGRTCDNANEALIKANVSLAFGYNQNRTMTYHDDKYLLPRYLMFSKMPMFYFKWIVE